MKNLPDLLYGIYADLEHALASELEYTDEALSELVAAVAIWAPLLHEQGILDDEELTFAQELLTRARWEH